MSSSFSNQVKAYRRRLGFAQSDMAVLLGDRSTSRVSRYERGRRLPPLLIGLTYQAIFGVAGAELFPKEYAAVLRSVRDRAKTLASKSHPKNAARAAQRKRAINNLLAR
ncbi:MAG: helix-turn-helix transcriptional regulator [Acidobacteria bacterium]|nr:helix-turn-helix transcriptional regulator [Acidobacteriota bacterium]MBV9068506.1 helix-turn-helix transcriptional regulator [Acidobacteriota bacterium]MBV9186654.1 helix-turn-helix transcriptional regulator [Acidobacteriota bacterium]